MNGWFAFILIVAGMLFAFSFRPNPRQQPVALPRGPVPLENNRTIPYDTPVIPAQKPKPAPTFGGYPCEGVCSEETAGYRWAQENGIADPDSCTGNTGEFIDGCRVYAQRRFAESWTN